MAKKIIEGCNAGKGCFNCPYPDCVNDRTAMNDAERQMYAASGLLNVTRAHRSEVLKSGRKAERND